MIGGLRLSWRLLATVLWIMALWLLFWNDWSIANLVGGLGVAVLVLWVSQPAPLEIDDEARVRISPLHLLYLLGYVLYQLVKANLSVAVEILRPTDRTNVGVVAVPLRTDDELVMMLVSNIITVTPGTITIETSGHPPVLYVNALTLDDVDATREDLLEIETVVVRAVGSRRARAQLAQAAQGARA